MTLLDWSQCPGLERDPEKLGGAWLFRGTRVPISAIFENVGSGVPIGEIGELFQGITQEQIRAVMEFAARSTRP